MKTILLGRQGDSTVKSKESTGFCKHLIYSKMPGVKVFDGFEFFGYISKTTEYLASP